MAKAATPPSPRSLRWIFAGVAVLCLAGLGLWWVFGTAAAPQVVVEIASPAPVTRVLAVNGKIAARNQVAIRSAVSATVTRVLAGEGDGVAAGDRLALLDDRSQRTLVAQAQSALAAGRIQQAQAAATFTRDQTLGGIIARSALENAQRSLETAVQDVARLTAALDQAEVQLSRYVISAPMAGTITLRSVDLGQLVDPATALFTLADLTELVVESDVDESYATQIATGQAATLRLIGQSENLDGRVDFVAPRVDPATGGLAVRIAFAVPLRAPVGLTVTANIVVDERTAITVPRSALMGDAVFVLRAGRAVLTPVTVIEWPADRLIVTDGLTAGDAVITDAAGITDGASVSQAAP